MKIQSTPTEITIKIDEITIKINEITIKIDEITIKIKEITIKIDEITMKIDEIITSTSGYNIYLGRLVTIFFRGLVGQVCTPDLQ